MKGGPRARGGRPPDPNALRRDRGSDHVEFVTLPREGRRRPVPSWPLTSATKREAELWRREWRRPQAVEWERLGIFVEVALFVRALVSAEQMDASVASRTLVRQQMDSLGLTTAGLRANRWRIGEPPTAPAERPARPQPRSVRDRLRLVDDDPEPA